MQQWKTLTNLVFSQYCPNHGPDIDRRGCALRLLREWSKIKQKPDTCVCFDMPSCKLRQDEKRESSEANCPLAEIEEVAQVDAYADPPPLSSPVEDVAAHALLAPSPDNEGAQRPVVHAPIGRVTRDGVMGDLSRCFSRIDRIFSRGALNPFFSLQDAEFSKYRST